MLGGFSGAFVIAILGRLLGGLLIYIKGPSRVESFLDGKLQFPDGEVQFPDDPSDGCGSTLSA